MLMPADTLGLILMMSLALIASRPWRSQGEEWFHGSALIAALLLAALLIRIA